MALEYVFLDMDGVTVDWFKGVLNLFEVPTTKEILNEIYFEASGWKSIEDSSFASQYGITNTEVHNRIDALGEVFWIDLEPTPFTPLHIIEDYVRKTDCELVFLTNPGTFLHAVDGKREWLRKNLTVPFKDIFTKEKYLLGYVPNSILIDDYYKMCKPFSETGRVLMYSGYSEHSRDNLKFLLAHEQRKN